MARRRRQTSVPHHLPLPPARTTRDRFRVLFSGVHDKKPDQPLAEQEANQFAMKIKSMKLREAHKNSCVACFCSILWDLQAQHIVTSSSSDNSICIHDALLLASPPRILRHHCGGVTSLALSPNSTCLASGSEDHSVKLYKFPVM